MIFFLDYYHPYAGLCNQLYLITNHIHDAYNKGIKLFIHKFNIDIFKKERVPISEVLDIHKTNENLKNLLGISILQEKCPETVEFIPKLCIYPVSSIPILNCLEFHGSILEKVHEIKLKIKEKYSAIHFRLDLDAIIHYTFGKDCYNNFMSNKISFESLDQLKITKYCEFLMNQYFEYLERIGFDNPWYICTSITKWKIHDPMKKYLQKLVDFIILHNGSYFIPPVIYPQRELNALIDLLILRDSEKMIGFEGSSFSEGYCLKVNSINFKIKEYYCIKEFNLF